MANSKALGVAYSDPALDACVIGATGGTVGFYGTTPTTKPAALTAELTALTHTAPGTPDYAVQNLTTSTPYGFVTADEGNTVLSVLVRTALRVQELEDKLQALGIIA